MRGVRERDVETAAAREATKRTQATSHRPRLGDPRRTAVRRAHDGVVETGVLEQLERLRERARGERHLVAPVAEERHERPEEHDVGRVREVDPNAHDPYPRGAQRRPEATCLR